MQILPMTQADEKTVLAMMRVFYASPAVHTNGSEEIFRRDFQECVGDSPFAEGYLFIEALPEGGAEAEAGQGSLPPGGRPIGYAMLAKSFSTEFGRSCIWVEDLFFLPEERGKGNAGHFFRFLGERYPEALFRLEVERENERAVRAYRKNGFSEMLYLEMKKE